jgi:hypothetical protein
MPSKRWTAQPQAGLGVGEDGEQPWSAKTRTPSTLPTSTNPDRWHLHEVGCRVADDSSQRRLAK